MLRLNLPQIDLWHHTVRTVRHEGQIQPLLVIEQNWCNQASVRPVICLKWQEAYDQTQSARSCIDAEMSDHTSSTGSPTKVMSARLSTLKVSRRTLPILH